MVSGLSSSAAEDDNRSAAGLLGDESFDKGAGSVLKILKEKSKTSSSPVSDDLKVNRLSSSAAEEGNQTAAKNLGGDSFGEASDSVSAILKTKDNSSSSLVSGAMNLSRLSSPAAEDNNRSTGKQLGDDSFRAASHSISAIRMVKGMDSSSMLVSGTPIVSQLSSPATENSSQSSASLVGRATIGNSVGPVSANEIFLKSNNSNLVSTKPRKVSTPVVKESAPVMEIQVGNSAIITASGALARYWYHPPMIFLT